MKVLRVGLTGGLSAGKSTLARLLAGRGAAVRDADAVVEELYRPNGPAVAPLIEVFGRDIVDRQGGVDRAKLARFIGQDPGLLATLNRIVHPMVREEIARWLAELERRERPPEVAVVEAALLVETGAYRQYHRLVVVTAPRELRLERAAAGGLSPVTAQRLLEAQADDEARKKVAHYVVENTGSLAELEAKAEALWRYLQADARTLAAGKPLGVGETVVL